MNQLISDINRWYDLQTAAYRENVRLAQMREKMIQSKGEYRDRDRAITEFSSGISGIFDKLFHGGKRSETLRREASAAKAEMDRVTRDWKTQEGKAAEAKGQCEGLPSLDALWSAAEGYPEAMQLMAHRERKLCGEMLAPLLQENLEALEAYRQYLRGSRAGEILTRDELHEIGAAHIPLAKQSEELLQRLEPSLKLLGISLEIPGYFQSPAGYLVTAAKHNQLDRMNEAISQVEAMQKLAAEFAKQET